LGTGVFRLFRGAGTVYPLALIGTIGYRFVNTETSSWAGILAATDPQGIRRIVSQGSYGRIDVLSSHLMKFPNYKRVVSFF
jgi:hypothetical protein